MEIKSNLKNQKALRGQVFDPEIVEQEGMRQTVEIVKFKKWSQLFEIQSSKIYEDEVQSFYVGIFVVDGATLYLKINGKDFVLDEYRPREILEVTQMG